MRQQQLQREIEPSFYDLQREAEAARKSHAKRSHIQRKLVRMKTAQIKSELPMPRSQIIKVQLAFAAVAALLYFAFFGIGG